MASKLGFLLSLFFVIQIFAFGGDFLAIQSLHASLDSLAVTIGKRISISGGITNEIKRYAAETAKARLVALSDNDVMVGEVYEFALLRIYEPIALGKSLTITIKRATIIGYVV